MPQAAGYSGKPLWQKLGLAGGQRLLLVTPPAHVEDLLAGAPAGITQPAVLRNSTSRSRS
jgi:hypothetical protein